MDLADLPAILDVTVHRQRRPHAGVRVHEGALHQDERRRRNGLPLTSPARTLLDVAAALHPRDLDRAIEEALVQRLVTPAHLRAVADRHRGHRGAAALREAAALHREPRATRSEAERRLLDIVDAAELPSPRTNVRVGAHTVDAVWRDERLVVEVDGFRFHGTRRAFERDRRRDADLHDAGYRTLRLTWRRIEEEPLAVAALLARHLSAAA